METFKDDYPDTYICILKSFLDPKNFAFEKPEHPNRIDFDPEDSDDDEVYEEDKEQDPIFELFLNAKAYKGIYFICVNKKY